MDNPRLLPVEECERVLRLISARRPKGRRAPARIFSWWNGEIRWGRNTVTLVTARRNINLASDAATNQTDDVSLESLIQADRNRDELVKSFAFPSLGLSAPDLPEPKTTIWSDKTFDSDIEERAKFIHVLCDAAKSEGMISAGYMEMRGGRLAMLDYGSESIRVNDFTQAQCSLTVRHPKGIGSGWAGLSSYDWASIDADAIAQRAMDKCIASLDPVAIEPGRYTVILEPDAVLSMVNMLDFSRRSAEATGPGSPWWLFFDFALQKGRSKLGLKVIDERITIQHDPTDPMLGVLPEPGMTSVKWITNGVLTSLNNLRHDALEDLNDNLATLDRFALHMSGGETSKEEMISSTERGLLVTRFSNLMLIDAASALCTGLTRDGLWLIENGKITKAVKNMRFTESPVFLLNQVQEMSVPVRTFRPVKDPSNAGVGGAVIPMIKARDFSFTSMVDAV